MTQGAPALSVVMITPRSFDMLRDALGHLRDQTLRDLIEIVFVAPERDGFDAMAAAVEGFWGHRLVEIGAITTTGAALAAGFRAASAPVVGYVEEHSYPEPGWAEALVEAHRGPWAAVGVGLANANPGSTMSWASLLLAFWDAVEPREAGEVVALPAHHIHYKRRALEAYDGKLEELLEVEPALCEDLRRRGERLYLAAGARERHVNVSATRSFLETNWLGGRAYAATRMSAGFSSLKRALYTLATPLIVAMKLRRLLSELERIGRRAELLPGILPQLLVGLTVFQLGEACSYVTGNGGGAAKARSSHELNRAAHLA
jgi:hypothetical protein